MSLGINTVSLLSSATLLRFQTPSVKSVPEPCPSPGGSAEI